MFFPIASVGEAAAAVAFNITGGTVTTVGSDKVHLFSTVGTLTVTGQGTIRLLIVGNGNTGGTYTNGPGGNSGAGGNGGQVLHYTSHFITAGTYNITIAGGVTFGTFSATTGGGAAGGLPPTSGTTVAGLPGTEGTTNDITGTNYVYGSGGGSGARHDASTRGALPGGNGGTGAGNGGNTTGDVSLISPPTQAINYGAGGGGSPEEYYSGSTYGYSQATLNSTYPGKTGVVIVRWTPA